MAQESQKRHNDGVYHCWTK